MTDYLVYSGGSGSGGTIAGGWANAYTTMAAALSGKGAGDRFFMAHDHAEVISAGTNWSFPGTVASPNYVICVNRAGSMPPVSADIQTTPQASITLNNSLAILGVVFLSGLLFVNSSQFKLATTGGNKVTLKDSRIQFATTGSAEIDIGPSSATGAAFCEWINVTVYFDGTSNQGPRVGGVMWIWRDTPSGAVDPSSAGIPAALMTAFFVPCEVLLKNLDLSALGSGKQIFPASTFLSDYQMVDCALGSSVLIGGNPTSMGCQIDAVNSDSATKWYREEHYSFEGTILGEFTVVRGSGAAAGAEARSWKMTTTANANKEMPLASPELIIFNDGVGTAHTITVALITDGVTLDNNDLWIDVDYLESSGEPIGFNAGTWVDPLNAGSALPADTVSSWTTTGLTTPTKQYVQSPSFTPELPGFYRVTVKLGKPSTTVYVDPLLQVA